MILQLEQFIEYESDKEMRCDATSIFFENDDRKELVFTHNEVAAIFHARLSKIYPKDEVVYFEVVDVNTGEIMHFSARKAMHKLMIKYMLYPPIIQKLFV